MNFAWCQGSSMPRASNIQSFSWRCPSSWHSVWQNLSVTWVHPLDVSITQHFIVMIGNFLSIVWNWIQFKLLLYNSIQSNIADKILRNLLYATFLVGRTLAGRWSPMWWARPTYIGDPSESFPTKIALGGSGAWLDVGIHWADDSFYFD